MPASKTIHNPPKWMTSFTYLMLLLLAFFILLLSISEIDAIKYKKLVLSFEHIFGLKKYSDNSEPLPGGSSIVLQEYQVGNTATVAVKAILENSASTFQDLAQSQPIGNAMNNLGASITQELSTEIQSGALDLQTNNDSITIRINEKYSFESGSDTIKPDLYPVLNKIGTIISQTPGMVSIAGFTDDIPMQNANFQDNWELSALRAYKVLSILLTNPSNNPERFTLIANAANHPLYINNSINNRAKNRRVEITLLEPKDKVIIHKNIKIIDESPKPSLNVVEQSDIN